MVSDFLELACSNSRSSERPKHFNWLMDDAVRSESEREKLDTEVENASLNYRYPPTPKDGNCMKLYRMVPGIATCKECPMTVYGATG